MDWTLYTKIVGGAYDTSADARREAREDFLRDAPANPAWMVAEVRGQKIGMLVKASDDPNVKWFNAPYDADIKLGDYVVLNSIVWLCTDISDTDDVTLKGRIYECNLNLQFQLGTPEIHSAWGYFDPGVYSTTTHGNQDAHVGYQQFKLMLPYNEYTRQLQRDKRIATEVLYYPDGHRELRCYVITSNDSLGSSFGNGRVLDLKLLEGLSSKTDNVDLMICDYISEDTAKDDTGGGWV
jgi:hypothetical protein|nr:MAG TPA: head closure knob [Caudoviricetes sp.]